MALGSERAAGAADLETEATANGAVPRTGPLAWLAALGPPLRAWYRRQPLVRLLSASLWRRIVVSNLLGFLVLLAGILYLSLSSGWLITAKREALRTQGKIIAAAIAADAKVSRYGIELDPEKLPSDQTRSVLASDGLASLELSIRPERIARLLKRLIEPTTVRARVYDNEGTLVVDSASLLSRGEIIDPQPKPDERIRTKNFWTRLTHWLLDKEMPVYKEIGGANGKYYPEVASALKGNETPMVLLDDRGLQMVSMAVPIKRVDNVLGVLLLSTRPGEIDDILAEERALIWPLAGMGLLASLITSFLLARTVAGPMRQLSRAAELVSRNINARQDLPEYADRRDEVGQMAAAFKSMTGALYRRIEASEKFAADVAHELKNPLTAARSTAESLAYAKTDEVRNELVKQIHNEIMRLNRLVTDVSKASRLEAELARQETVAVDLAGVLDGVRAILTDKSAQRGCELVVSVDPTVGHRGLVVRGHEGRLAQVVTNLVDNAISFSPAGARVVLSARRDGTDVVIAVEDRGPGIEEDKLETIFKRFYTYRPTADSSRGDNSGLGLSISREIVHAHGGSISAENVYEETAGGAARRIGARFVVRLPAAPATSGRAQGAAGGRS